MKSSTVLSNHLKGIIITFAGVMLLTPDGLLVRLVEADAFTLLFWRGIGLGVCILGARKLILRGSRKSVFYEIGWPGVFFAIIFGVGNLAFVLSFSYTDGANVLFIISSVPLFSAIIARVFLKEKVRAVTWLSILIALSGIGLIVFSGLSTNDGSFFGEMLALLATISLAVNLSIAREWRDRSMVPAMGLGGLMTSLISLPFLTTFHVSEWSILFLILMGLLGAIGFSLLSIGPRYITAPEVSIMLLLESVIGSYWIWLILGEEPTIMTIAGGAVVILSIVLLNVFVIIKERMSPV